MEWGTDMKRGYIGQKFGKLASVKPTGRVNSNKQAIWIFRCECGKEVERSAGQTKRDHKLGGIPACESCRHHHGLPGNVAARNATIRYYKANARERGLEFRLEDGMLDRLFSSDCHYCGTPPGNKTRGAQSSGDFVYQGIDRIDVELDYVPFNVLPCCARCNYAKRKMDYMKFVSWINCVSLHLNHVSA